MRWYASSTPQKQPARGRGEERRGDERPGRGGPINRVRVGIKNTTRDKAEATSYNPGPQVACTALTHTCPQGLSCGHLVIHSSDTATQQQCKQDLVEHAGKSPARRAGRLRSRQPLPSGQSKKKQETVKSRYLHSLHTDVAIN